MFVKLTKDHDVKAYLHMFESIPLHEQWDKEELRLLHPFLK